MASTSRSVGYAVALLGLGALCVSGTAVADDVIDVDPNNRPAFLIISCVDEFDVPTEQQILDGATGSPVVLVNIGTYLAGENIKGTRFEGLNPVIVDLRDVPIDEDGSFDDHQFTMLGSFKTLDPDATVHMMTPYPGGVSDAAEQAFFNASPGFDTLDRFPTTVSLAQFVHLNQGDAGATLTEIMQAMFEVPTGSALEMVCHSPCEAEGTLFPHEDEVPDTNFHALFDPTDLEETIVAVDVCRVVEFDVKPNNSQNSINIGHNGDLPVAVLTQDGFDAVEELDPATVVAVLLDDHGQVVPGSEVYADHWAEEDVDDDGDLDVILHFSVPDLVAGDDSPLNGDSTSLAFRGDTFNGQCVEGSDSVRTVGH